jgi:hypothetical protein
MKQELPLSSTTTYRGFDIETRIAFDGRTYLASFTIQFTTSLARDRITRIVDGEFLTENDALAAAEGAACALIEDYIDRLPAGLK